MPATCLMPHFLSILRKFFFHSKARFSRAKAHWLIHYLSLLFIMFLRAFFLLQSSVLWHERKIGFRPYSLFIRQWTINKVWQVRMNEKESGGSVSTQACDNVGVLSTPFTSYIHCCLCYKDIPMECVRVPNIRCKIYIHSLNSSFKSQFIGDMSLWGENCNFHDWN